MCTVFENELFQVQKGALVLTRCRTCTSDFHDTLSKDGLTFNALLVAYSVRDHERLLQEQLAMLLFFFFFFMFIFTGSVMLGNNQAT